MKQLKPYNCGRSLVRYGKDNDGGYIVAEYKGYSCFLSCGIGNDLSFEVDFMNHCFVYDAHAFDGTSMFIEENQTGIVYHRINIGTDNTDTTTNMHEYLKKYSDVFLKMDIEGHERAWLDATPDELLLNISQLVIEFHGLDISLPYIERLNKMFTLVHVHGNNYGGVVEHDGKQYPNVFECTFVNNSLIHCLSLYVGDLPCAIDQPNNQKLPDIDLNFLLDE